MRYPADVVFRRDDFEARVSFQDAGENDFRQGALDLVDKTHGPEIAVIFEFPYGVSLRAMAGEDMQADGHFQFCGGSPEGLEHGVGVATAVAWVKS